jgi:hypothetical protein
MGFLQGLCTKLLIWSVEVYEIFARALHRAISMGCWGVWDFCKGSAPSYSMRCMGFLQGLCTKLLVWGVEVYGIFARALHRAISMGCMGFLQGLCIKLLVWDVEMYGIFARTSHRVINMRCMRFSRKRRNVAKKSDAMLWRKATHCCEKKRRNVAKTKATHCCEDKSDALLRRHNVNKVIVTCHHLKTSFLFKYEDTYAR